MSFEDLLEHLTGAVGVNAYYPIEHTMTIRKHINPCFMITLAVYIYNTQWFVAIGHFENSEKMELPRSVSRELGLRLLHAITQDV